MATKARKAGAHGGSKPARPGREKVSVTIDRAVLEEIRKRADNLSEYVNETLERDLYRQRIRDELARLDAEGVVGDPRAEQWWREKFEQTRRRLAAKRAAEEKAERQA